jgi:apolipoprotein N-acyltransferase
MDRNQGAQPFAVVVTAALASALGFYFGTGLHPVWWLTWLAPLPLLLIVPKLPRLSAFCVSWLVSILGATNLWHYFRHDLETPLLLCVIFTILPGAIFAFGVLLFRRCVLGGSPILAALIFPSFWVTYEYLQAISSPHSTALNLAYSQMDFLPVLQLASLTGIWGISFCLCLVPATLATLPVAGRQPQHRKWLVVSGTAFLLAVFGFGGWRLGQHEASNFIPVALLASDLPQNAMPTTEPDTMRLLREYVAQMDLVSTGHVAAFVLPEKIGVVRESYLESADSLLSSAAVGHHAVVVVGLVRRDSHGLWNEARIYLPEGGPPLTYEKHHMLPAFESQFIVGTALLTLQQPSGTWGITICKDMDFPLLSRQYGLRNTGLLLVPAWDFDSDGWLHGRMGILRGVESGFSIARAPRHGILTLTDDRGRVLAERNTASHAFASIVADIPVAHHATLYSKWGDWFAWLCVATFLASVLASRKKASSAASAPRHRRDRKQAGFSRNAPERGPGQACAAGAAADRSAADPYRCTPPVW